VVIAFDSLEKIQAWRKSEAFKESWKIGDKYAKYRSYAIEGMPQ
jgi:heme-degrading monooxygenase HmoA